MNRDFVAGQNILYIDSLPWRAYTSIAVGKGPWYCESILAIRVQNTKKERNYSAPSPRSGGLNLAVGFNPRDRWNISPRRVSDG